jgi:hypothetical protein
MWPDRYAGSDSPSNFLDGLSLPLAREGEEVAELLAWENMEWVRPKFRRSEVDWAGRTFAQGMSDPAEVGDDDWWRAMEIINNWRASHAYPLNTFQVTLRNKARRVDSNAIVAQRTKRLWSIWHKLDRFKTTRLSQMQDIGGCRAIMQTSQQVRDLLHDYQRSSLRHVPRRTTDYIEKPRDSGYRGIHVIWAYSSDTVAKAMYNDLQIEMQIRSVLQHAWATTVETVGILTRQALKSSLGEGDWLRFFALMGAVVACRENTPPVPGTPNDRSELIAELKDCAIKVNATARLHTIADAIHTLEQPSARETNAHFFLLELSPDILKITGYTAAQQVEAQEQYAEVEKRITKEDNSDAVLVSVDSLAALRRAYPNYFLDTRVFATLLEEALDGRLLEQPCFDV